MTAPGHAWEVPRNIIRTAVKRSFFVLFGLPCMLYCCPGNDAVYPASAKRPQISLRMAQSRARLDRHAAGLSPVRLRRHRQDDARTTHRGASRWRREVRRLHRQGCIRDARQGVPRRLHHPWPDLSGARKRRRNSELRSVGRSTGLKGRTDHHRRMLDGRRRARTRPAVVRRARPGAG